MAFRLITLLVTITWLCAATAFITQDTASRVIIFLSVLLFRELFLFKNDLRVPQ